MTKQILSINLNLPVIELNSNLDSVIHSKLKSKVEGLCFENGYILKDSINIINRDLGKLSTINDKSFINFRIKYSADIILPSIGDIIDNFYIYKKNKMGLIAYFKYKDYNENNSPINAIIPNEYIDNIDDYSINDKIRLKIEGVRIKFRSTNIQVIAKIV
jgi:DNA-directed RNA polymerase subunit E'/Rpb7